MITNAVHGEGISHYDIKNVNLVEMDTIIRERDKVRKCRMSFKTNKKEYLKAEDYDLIDAILSKICNGAYISQENSILTFLDNLKKLETEMEKTPQTSRNEEDCDKALAEECY